MGYGLFVFINSLIYLNIYFTFISGASLPMPSNRWCTTYRWFRCVLGHEQLSVHREKVNKADRAPSICQNQIINLPFIRPMFSYIQRSNLDSRTISEFI
mgnify:CR=1 FL=1